MIKRSLEPHLPGLKVMRVRLHRRDILNPPSQSGRSGMLLRDQTLTALHRHGKQLAIEGSGGGVVLVHMGMTGSLRYLHPGERLETRSHVHCEWFLSNGKPAGRLIFRDPRRFGGIWALPSMAVLKTDRWSRLGPDALSITLPQLRAAFAQTTRALKSALLDQKLIAGLGNIYVDEALFIAHLHPSTPCIQLDDPDIRALHAAIRKILRAAIRGGGSTLRDYVDGNGRRGEFAQQHVVYGRGGQPCLACATRLENTTVGGRTTVHCPHCQSASH